MLEAVNSSIANATYTKAIADQQSVVNSFAANPARVQQASLQAPYISLYIKVDVQYDKALLLQRDRDTGDVVRQIPSEAQLEAYRRAQSVFVSPTYDEADTEVTTTSYEPSVPTVPEASVPEASVPEASVPEASVPEVSKAPAQTSAPAPAPVSIDTEV